MKVKTKPVRDYEQYYEAHSNGKVFSIRKQRFLKAHPDNCGYLHIKLCKDGHEKSVLVHRVIAENFVCGSGYVNHIDGNKQNNDYKNLEFVTHSENVKHAFDNGLNHSPSGDKSHAFKGAITATCLSSGKEIKMSGTKEIKANGFSPASVYSCLSGKRNSHKGHSFYR